MSYSDSQYTQQVQKRWSRRASWLLPGLSLKRWVGLFFVGLLLAILGLALLLQLQPISWSIEIVKSVAPAIPSWLSGSMLVLGGAIMLMLGWKKATGTVLTALGDHSDLTVLEQIYRRRKLDQGPRIVAVGGGTGLSTLLRGIKHYTNNITAIVTVADDGGSSGRLRQEFNIIPPGDIRNCIAALANEEELITELFQYRFKLGEGLKGHSFGNLFLSVMCEITGNMNTAVKESAKVLNIRGRVIPATLENVELIAHLEDGSEVRGESNIPEAGKPIAKLRCEPANAQPLPEVIEAIAQAELIILGPGSLFTSVLPNLLIQAVADAIHHANAPKIYVCNVMSQPGETHGYTVGDHLQALLKHCPGQHMVDMVVVNNWIPESLIRKYQEHGQYPVVIDRQRIEDMGIGIIERVLVDDGETIRHNSRKLGRSIIRWYKKHYGRSGQKQSVTLIPGTQVLESSI
ncbi:MAG: YvcK family protein [Cyanobacteria bacterium HKST-UBA05]|nr:YvcK family protein [Cyanobacteria bacterium HKST-UBA05]